MNCVRIPGSPEHPPIKGRIPDENRIPDETRISDATRISDVTRQSATARTASAYPFTVPLHMPEAGRNQPRPHADTDADADANTLLGAIPATDRSSYASPDGNGDTPPAAAPENVEAFQRVFAELSERIAADIIGKPTAIRQLLTVLFAGGHLCWKTSQAPEKHDWPAPRRTQSARRSDASSSHRICCRPMCWASHCMTRAPARSRGGRGRYSPRWCWPTRSTGPHRKRSRLYWR